MGTSILANQDFILDVQEKWDSYSEVVVKFVDEVAFDGYAYHSFADEKTDKHYYLRSRYSGHQIEGVLVERQVIVDLFLLDADFYQGSKRQAIFYATGILKLTEA